MNKENGAHQNIWCLPFAKLNAFYAKFGFDDDKVKSTKVPKAVLQKYNWCNSTCDDQLLLLVK